MKQFTRYVAVAALVLSPLAARAQVFVISGGSATMSTDGNKPSDTTQKAATLNADSLAKLRKLAQSKSPVIIIDDTVTTTKSFNALPLARIASIDFQEASEGDIKFYGAKAEHGIWTIKTRPPEAKGAAKTPADTTAKKRRRHGGSASTAPAATTGTAAAASSGAATHGFTVTVGG